MAEPARPTEARPWRVILTGVALACGVGWVVDTGVLWALGARLGLPLPLAAATGFLTSGVVNFTLNRWVFSGRQSSRLVRQSLRYAFLFLLNLAAVTLLVPWLAGVLEQLLKPHDIALVAAKALVTAGLWPLNTAAYRYWVFPLPSPAESGGDAPLDR